MKRSILLNITFLSASSNSTLVILLREKKKTIYCLHGRWFLFMRKKSSCINYSVNTMTSCTRNLARAPYPQLSAGEYRGRIVRHQRLKTEPMLLRVLYNSLKKMNYLWLNKVLNRRGKLWTCFLHFKAGSQKIIHIDDWWLRANHSINHDICTIAFNPENWFL